MKNINTPILLLKVGQIKDYKKDNILKKEFVTAIKKLPIENSYLTKVGFEDDNQADKIHHGGIDKAVLFMSKTTYNKIQTQAKKEVDYALGDALGENIVVDAIDENDICVGDVFKLGNATIEVSQPREPCWKLSASTAIKEMTNIILKNGYTGWYVRVLEEGQVKINDSLILIKRDYPELSIIKLNQLLNNPLNDEVLTKSALNCEKLSLAFKESLKKKYDKTKKS